MAFENLSWEEVIVWSRCWCRIEGGVFRLIEGGCFVTVGGFPVGAVFFGPWI